MSEQYPKKPTYEQRAYDYYLGRPDQAEKRAEYISRGLVPTNNLSLLIVDEPRAEIAPGTGIPNPYDYTQQPYGPMIEALKNDHPELWEQAKEATAKCTELLDLHWDTISKDNDTTSEAAKEIASQCEIAGWHKAEVYTQVIHILGPQLDAAGIDITEICR